MWNRLSLLFLPPVQNMCSSISHMVFTWMEMFSHIFSRYWSPVFAGSVFHVENSLLTPWIWPVQLDGEYDLGWTEVCFLLPFSPVEADSTAAPVCSQPVLGSWSGSQSLAEKEIRKSWGGEKDLIFLSNRRDSSLNWEETEHKQSSDWWSRAPTLVDAFCFN